MNKTPTKMNKFGIKAFFPPKGPDVEKIINFSPAKVFASYAKDFF